MTTENTIETSLTRDDKTTPLPLTEAEEELLSVVLFLQDIKLIVYKINGRVKALLDIRSIIQTYNSTGTLVEWTAFRTAITMSLNKNGVR